MKILMAVDTNLEFENTSDRLTKFLNIFNSKEICLDLFHSYERPVVRGAHMPVTKVEIEEDEKKYQSDLINKMRNTIEAKVNAENEANFIVNTFLEEGDFFKKLDMQLSSQNYDMLILVPTQRDQFDKFFKKDKVDMLINKVDVPILILPKLSDSNNV